MKLIRDMFGLWVVATTVCVAAAQSDTLFTYQGSLSESGQPASGLYNMDFLLWNDAAAGQQIGQTVMVDDVEVNDGLFTVELDFGADVWKAVRWLEIEVNGVTLIPRQQVTSSPYAVATRGFHMGATGQIGIGTTDPQDDIHIRGVVDSFPRLRLGNSNISWSGFHEYDTRTLSIEKYSNKHSTIELNPMSSSANHNRTVDFFRQTLSDNQPEARFMRGNGLVDISALIATGGGDSYFQAHGGNFGIGTANPQYPFEAVGDGVFRNRLGVGNPDFLFGQLTITDSDDGAVMAISADSDNVEFPTIFANNNAGGPTIWAIGGSESSLASGGDVVIGDDKRANLSIDTNEIMARNNGGPADLVLNAEGGRVRMGLHGITPAFAFGRVNGTGAPISVSTSIAATHRNGVGEYEIVPQGGVLPSDVLLVQTNETSSIATTIYQSDRFLVFVNGRISGNPIDTPFSFVIYRQ